MVRLTWGHLSNIVPFIISCDMSSAVPSFLAGGPLYPAAPPATRHLWVAACGQPCLCQLCAAPRPAQPARHQPARPGGAPARDQPHVPPRGERGGRASWKELGVVMDAERATNHRFLWLVHVVLISCCHFDVRFLWLVHLVLISCCHFDVLGMLGALALVVPHACFEISSPSLPSPLVTECCGAPPLPLCRAAVGPQQQCDRAAAAAAVRQVR